MKKLIFNALRLLVPLLVLIVGFNLYIDPAHLFSEEYYNKCSELLKNNNVILKGDCNERRLLKAFVSEKSGVDLILLGSSRALIIDSQHVQSNSMLNLSCSGADLEDVIAVFGLYKSKHSLPQKIILGIDPWMFNINRKSDRFLELANQYNDMAELLKLTKVENKINTSTPLFELLSLDYFQNSVLQWKQNDFSIPIPEKTSHSANKTEKVKKSNGTLVYPTNWQNTPDLILIAAKRYISEKHIYGLNNYNELSKERLLIFERFLGYLQNNKVSIEVFLSPYHPIVWSHFQKNDEYKMVMESEKIMRSILKKKNIKVLGSYSPIALKLKNTDFFDGMHPNLKGLDKIFTQDNFLRPKL